MFSLQPPRHIPTLPLSEPRSRGRTLRCGRKCCAESHEALPNLPGYSASDAGAIKTANDVVGRKV
jgi:hypothetical protein